MQRYVRFPRRPRAVKLATALSIGIIGISSSTDASTTTEPDVDATAPLLLGATGGWEVQVEPFVNAAGLTADGRALVEIAWEWQDANNSYGMEAAIVDAVASGELDFGYVGSRAFAELGVDSLAALTAPFLVDSYGLQQAVLDSDLPARMMDGLDALGLTGLTVTAGPLRRPLAVDGPLLSPGDFAGITFHTYPLANHADSVAALGATHTDVYGDARDEGILDGTIDATENSLSWALNNGVVRYVTLNAALWPATAVLIANPDSLGRLSAAELVALQDAAATSFETADQFAADDAALLEELCAAGIAVVEASDDDLSALRAAVEPVYSQLAGDAETEELLAEIGTMKATTPADGLTVPDACTGEATVPASIVAEGADDPSVLNGTYQFEWTVDELMEQTGLDEDAVRGNTGPVTITFSDGTFDQVWEETGDSCPGTYGITGDRIVMVATSDIGEWDCGGDSLGVVLADAAWDLTGDQLVLSDFVLSDEPDITWWNAVFLSKPMTRVG